MMEKFFDAVRVRFGALSQSQVDGFNTLLRETEGMGFIPRAYVLATAWHETARTMQPIAEYGRGRGKPYGKADETGKAPYGRGFVQITWRDNYAKADRKLGLGGALSKDYDLAMRPDTAAKIIARGMTEGWFTGKKLADYTSYRDMRRIVNGTDKAITIAGYAEAFEGALRAAAAQKPVQPLPPPKVQTPPPAPESQPATPPAAPRGLLRALLDLLLAMFTRKG